MKKIVFDIETNGLYESLDTVHCICIGDVETGEIKKFSSLENNLDEALRILQDAEQIIGVNSVDFDVPALEKVYPSLKLSLREKWTEHLDLQLFARLKFPDVTGRDFSNLSSGFPRNLIGKHSLEAWGYRIGSLKGTYGKTSNWEECTPEMVDYCAQDVRVSMDLYKYLRVEEYSSEAIQIEHDVRRYITWQERSGVPFDTQKARELYKSVKEEYDQKWSAVKAMFPDKTKETTWVPKVNSTKYGYKKGVPTVKTEVIQFNPGSRQQLIDYFKEKYNWVPVDFTEKGSPEIGYDVLVNMPYEEAKVIAELFDMKKLMGMLYDGDSAWIKMVKDGSLHGRIITNGAISGRMTHFSPNIAQTPNAKAYKGRECRDLFWSGSDDLAFVDGDAAALEVRLFAHYLARWDGGEYANIVLNGDIHTENMKAFGLTDRNTAKTLFFAMLYGCGAVKAGYTVNPKFTEDQAKSAGREIIGNFKRARPAYSNLVDAIYTVLKSRGHIVGLDGRLLVPRSQHAGLNTLIQGAGAVLMKKATVLFAPELKRLKGIPALHIHDEISVIVPKENAKEAGEAIKRSIELAGEHFKLKIPMTGAYNYGKTWGDSH